MLLLGPGTDTDKVEGNGRGIHKWVGTWGQKAEAGILLGSGNWVWGNRDCKGGLVVAYPVFWQVQPVVEQGIFAAGQEAVPQESDMTGRLEEGWMIYRIHNKPAKWG